MDTYLAALRRIEAQQSWRSESVRLRTLLRERWTARDWLCYLSCLDFLGELDQLARELDGVPESKYRSPPEAYALRMYMFGRLCQSLGEYGKALKCYMNAVAVNPTDHTSALLSLQTGTINRLGGKVTDARLAMERTLEKASKVGDPHAAAHAADYLVALAISSDDLPAAERWLMFGKDLASKVSNSYRSAWLSFSEGELLWVRGERERGVDLMKSVCDGFRYVGALSAEVHALSRLSARLQAIERWEESEECLIRADYLARGLRYNVARSLVLSGFAALYRHRGVERSAVELETRSAFIKERARREIEEERAPHTFARGEIKKFLEDLSPDDFEILCLHMLTHEGFNCRREPLNNPDFDIEAVQSVRVTARIEDRITWKISCKRYFQKNVQKDDLPDISSISRTAGEVGGSQGVMLMTTGRLTKPAEAKLRRFPEFGIRIDVWDGDRIVEFLSANDHLLSVVLRVH